VLPCGQTIRCALGKRLGKHPEWQNHIETYFDVWCILTDK